MKFPTNTTPTARLRSITLAATMALALGSAVALAQPAGPMMGGGFGGPGMHAMQGAGLEGMLPRALEQAKASLNLTAAQLVAWNAVVADGKAARAAARANRQQVKDALVAELGKPDPDLAAVAAVADTIHQQNQAVHKNVRNEWLAFYSTQLTTDQKVIVRDLLRQKIARAEAFQQIVQQRMNAHWGASGN